MIHLFSMPSASFNCPQISIPLISGFLNENNIGNIQYDLTLKFLDTCINDKYIKKIDNAFYNKLTNNEKKIVDSINYTVEYMKRNKFDSNKLIIENFNFGEYLKILGNYYNVKWERRDILLNEDLKTIDDMINFSVSEKNSLFDDALSVNYEIKKNDIIYLSVQYPFQLRYALRFSKMLKKEFNNINIFIGGDYITHININIEELINKFEYIDCYLFFGNHSNLLDAIKTFKNGKGNIKNCVCKLNGKVYCNYNEKNTTIDLKSYVPSFRTDDLNRYVSNLKIIPLNLNYGCYHSGCKFCSRYYFYNGKAQYDQEKIFNLVKRMYEEEKIEGIYFVDECVLPENLISFANFLIENNIKIKWMVETRVDNKLANDNVPQLLYKSGCREISFGIESYNKKILKDMNKKIDINVAKIIMKKFYDSGISVSATFMIGYPTENKVNIWNTLNFISKYKNIDTFGISIFNYMRNSKLVQLSDEDLKGNLNLIYKVNNKTSIYCEKILRKFNKKPKIHDFVLKRNMILYRTEYMYLDRKSYSLNYQ